MRTSIALRKCLFTASNYSLIVGLLGAGTMLAILLIGWIASGHLVDEPPNGRELFTREWQPHDPRSHGGDGLGPVFNDSSCVACHNQGGVGGGGAKAKNVVILSLLGSGAGGTPNGALPQPAVTSFVLHHFGTDEGYEVWRKGRNPIFFPVSGSSSIKSLTATPVPSQSQRQTPALFGAGLIDSIPEHVLRELALVRDPEFPDISGRVVETASGGVGRFGWKGQTARLDEFVITACAVELGLQVPDKEQPLLPHRPDYKAPGLDMNQAECDALIRFVRHLPRPQQQSIGRPGTAKHLAEGRVLFNAIGCATCHVPQVGTIDGIYSDLLLHDMGTPLSDVGSSYGLFRPANPSQPPPQPAPLAADAASKTTIAIAAPTEWRTPPLWGVRDSAPYLHDGRADTLTAAIALHDGEAKKSRDNFQRLPHECQLRIVGFLKSLAAPAQ
ncbi:MAG: hypothetical protein K8T91_27410 [Planctomycetes bacterium]|nr:hypothetical protein [Planctomycetota bacterium]